MFDCGRRARIEEVSDPDNVRVVDPASIVMWNAILLVGADSLTGEAGKHFESLPGLFATSCEAMDAAEAAMLQRPDALMAYACRVVVR